METDELRCLQPHLMDKTILVTFQMLLAAGLLQQNSASTAQRQTHKRTLLFVVVHGSAFLVRKRV